MFRSPADYTEVEHIVGRATVEIDDDTQTVTTTIVSKEYSAFTQFVLAGDLKSLTLSGMITNVDPEKAKEFWARQP